MPEARAAKPYHQLNLGINTELSELSYDEGFTTDECNYELLVDGSRRRRRGLKQESGGSSHTALGISNTDTNIQCGAYLWKNVGGDPTKRFWVHKIGEYLYFTDDSATPSSSWHPASLELDAYALQSSMSNEPVDFAQGKGSLFVTGKYIKPIYITYDASGDTFTATPIDIRIRDYTTIDDGILIGEQPSSLTADHEYNLLNRGWRGDDIDDYQTNSSNNTYPGKNQVWHNGYRRRYGTSIAEEDGTYEFSAAKMEAFPFANASAPTGSLFVNIFYDLIGTWDVNPDGSLATVSDSSPSLSYSAPTITITVDETAHGFSGGESIDIIQGKFRYEVSTGDAFNTVDLAGETVTVSATPTANTWSFEVPTTPPDFGGPPVTWTQTLTWTSSGQIERSSGTGPLDVGPTAIEFHAGRLFYAGVPDSTWADYIFYSQVAIDESKYRQCHTEADPTNMIINDPVVTDGGYIQIPDIGNVVKMLTFRDSLLLFSDEGVWEISSRGIFSPVNYQVRKITSAECDSPHSPIVVDGTCFYTGPKGIYAIAPNQYTQALEATNISDERIRTVWNNIGPAYRPRVRTVYDDALKRLYFFHGGGGNLDAYNAFPNSLEKRHYSVALILDLRVGAWYKYAFASDFKTTGGDGILYAFAISGEDTSDTQKKLKVVWQRNTSTPSSTTPVVICDFDHEDFEDEFLGGTESPLPYMLTGWDNVGDWQRRRTAPVVTVFSRRTETGWTDTGNGFEPDNPSSTLMRAVWDWTSDDQPNNSTGKLGQQVQVYRDTRNFIPAGVNSEMPYQVLVTRNKVRGRGRALQLRFDGEAGKDSHLVGLTINYKVGRKV